MNPYFLDVAGAGFAFAYGLIVLFMLLTVLLEAVVMILMKYNIRFKKAFLDSLLVNLVTLAVGFMLLATSLFASYGILNLLILYAMTVAIEFAILYLLNRSKKVTQTLSVALVMNLVSYLLFAAITGF